jgi:hypothetical protein
MARAKAKSKPAKKKPATKKKAPAKKPTKAKKKKAPRKPKPARVASPVAELDRIGEEAGGEIKRVAARAADDIERIADHAADVIHMHSHGTDAPDACEAVEEIDPDELESMIVHEIDDRSPQGRLRASVAAIPDFADYLRELGATGDGEPWLHADTPQLAGLERWGKALTAKDRHAGIAALVRAAQHGFPIAATAGGGEIVGIAFRGQEGDQIVDGAAVEVQIARAARWLDDPSTIGAVDEAYDRTRQLNVWDDDLRPSDRSAFHWYLDVGQCCCAAILRGGGNPAGDSYYEWPPPVTVGRGLVMAVRGIRNEGADLDQILTDLGAALTA